MAWVDLSSAFGYGTKLTSTQMQNLRDNIAAAFAKNAGAPQLAADYVHLGMIEADSVPLPFCMAVEEDVITTTETDPETIRVYQLYIPPNATTIRMTARIKSDGGDHTMYCRFTVDGNSSDIEATSDTAYAWYADIVYDVSALSGWVALTIDIWVSVGIATGYLQGFTFFYE